MPDTFDESWLALAAFVLVLVSVFVLAVYRDLVFGVRADDRPADAPPDAPSSPTRHESGGAVPVSTRWYVQVLQALHLLIIGHSGGGKTTLIHDIAVRRARVGRVVVCDPDAAPGLWPNCEVAGYGNDFAAIERALQHIAAEVATRRQQRGSGQRRQFAPIHLIIDEYADVTVGCPAARPLVEDILRRGRKLAVHLVIGVQDKQVKTLGFEGQGDLRKNFSFVVEVAKDASDNRTATLITADGVKTLHAMLTLPDPEKLVDAAATSTPPAPTEHGERLLRQALGTAVHAPVHASSAVQDGELLNRTSSAYESGEPKFSSSVELAENAIKSTTDDAELNYDVAAMVQRLKAHGMNKNAIIETIWGARPGGTAAYKRASATYDRISNA